MLTSTEDKERQYAFREKYSDALKAFSEKYRMVISAIHNQKRDHTLLNNMQELFGIENAFVFDVVKLQQSLRSLNREKIPYSHAMVSTLQKSIDAPFLSEYIVVENDRLKAELEANKTKEGFTINEVEKSEGDELFDALVKKFRGKVVYVDFWATWCGPCKSGIKRMKPLKEEMKDQDVVFLYITGPSSPETTWKNSIPDIKGEHYRVSADEWNYLKDKFKISGIPHYALVNRKGTVIKGKMGHRSNSQLKTLLENEMDK